MISYTQQCESPLVKTLRVVGYRGGTAGGIAWRREREVRAVCVCVCVCLCVFECLSAHIAGELFVVLHELFILLIDSQHFADAVGRRLRLEDEHTHGMRIKNSMVMEFVCVCVCLCASYWGGWRWAVCSCCVASSEC